MGGCERGSAVAVTGAGQRPLAARASEQAGRRGGFIWGRWRKKGKKKIEIGKFTKKILS
jgi:hypothetical protein